jgi:hypothetical protein
MNVRVVFVVIGAACALYTASPAVAAPVPPYQAVAVGSPSPEAKTVFGEVMHTIGDIDHDGVREVITKAETTVSGLPRVGRVWVLDGESRAVLLTLNDPDPQLGAGFGSSITGLGDVNGDGVPDIAVGAPFTSVNGNAGQGRVYVFSGKDGRLLYSVDDPTPQPHANFGGLFATATGDLNGDGVPDFATVAPGEDVNGVATAGAAYVFEGKDGNMIRRIPNPSPETFTSSEVLFGMGLTNPGDVNGDHVDDLVVGFAGTTVNGNVNQGRAYLFSGKTGSLLRTLDDPVPQANAYFGSMYSDPYAPGDVNGDGVRDLYVDADGQTTAGLANAGQAYLFSGRDGRLLRTLKSPMPQDSGFFGFIFSPAGDLYRNGSQDLLVAQTGSAHLTGAYAVGGTWVLDPRNGNVLADFTSIAPDTGQGIASPGDVNGDGIPDYFLSAPRADIGNNPRQGIAFQVLSVPGVESSLTAQVRKHIGTNMTSFTISGRLLVPTPLDRNACGGLVSIQIKRGSRTVSRQQVALAPDCSYRQHTSIPNSRLRRPGRNRIIIGFLGNYLVRAAGAITRVA